MDDEKMGSKRLKAEFIEQLADLVKTYDEKGLDGVDLLGCMEEMKLNIHCMVHKDIGGGIAVVGSGEISLRELIDLLGGKI